MNGLFIKLATVAALAGGLGAASAFGQEFGASATTNLSVTIGPEAAIAITTADTALATSGGLFAPFTGTTNFLYKIRTAQTDGQGHISLKITSDFDGSGGPSVAKPPTAGDALTYTCTTGSGTPCDSGQTASTSATTPVASFGSDVHSARDGDAGSVAWSLTNDPAYKTGTYTAVATLTISIP